MKICLSGYYGFDNAGDEALLSAITSTIKQIDDSAEFVVFSGYPEKTAALHGLKAVSRINPFVIIKELWQADLLISGGGSLLQDVTSSRSLPYYISIVLLAKLLRRPVIFYAQGIGPINRGFSKFLMHHIANKVDLITLRDNDSISLLKEMNITKPPIKVTADPVFTLEPSETDYERADSVLSGFFPDVSNVIGVSVRKWRPLEGYQELLAKVLDRLVQKGYNLVFVPMDYPNDVYESHKVANLMTEKAYVIEDNLSSFEHIALISRLDLMIGMRLHSLIFSASRGVPFAGISYDPKIDAFVNAFGLEPLALDYDEMNGYIDRLLEDKSMRDGVKRRSEEMKTKAEETAHLALGLMK
ncbi:Polysaccharide pyruvyl transferase CsaB [Candidatus Syntrophocurvum alkaliphilum]|uniref:Polysaccharide pyruvyl transferase CsaB n=1 Tax=Candidatus Syntrophocurvum alkaliphilum TaxID=2293317 RepID=A0A6I6DID1_9FIRM|nr:polysaccharide pyruvyl transferase CsaB [Candidatus Syntrophocurvum alkaliphilum]QGU00489.1 Polysaccharide pyruvyl transferase CsaB [Candidatus Syntrophocurvum alkaliphilum]